MIFTDLLNGKILEKPPVWIMRQAGRYLPEYREVRKSADNFIDFCLTPEKACEVTLQPIRRYDFDASIIFSDILLVPHAMGREVKFIPGTGPVLEKLSDIAELNLPSEEKFLNFLKPVSEAVSLTRSKLPEKTALIGFSGAPWTLMTYMLEGGSSRDFNLSRQFLWSEPAQSEKLLRVLCEYIVCFLSLQAKAGANVLMLFDSWAGAVPAARRQSVIIDMHNQIIADLRARDIQLPVISFPKGLSEGLIDYSEQVDIQALGLDHYTDRHWAARNLRKDIVLQGNMDPLALVAGGDQMKAEIDDILECFSNRRHIFNLGHGIVPQTPPENVSALLAQLRG
ncbi:MAG: uroporphyrinogen decarboxylase [Candidatus Puniceispirillaceae bacterium]